MNVESTSVIPILQQFEDVVDELEVEIDKTMHQSVIPETLNDEFVQIEIEDIQDKIDYWNSYIVCYVIGANPPLPVMKGFIRRI